MENSTIYEYSRLKELSKSDFEIYYQQADIRNWKVIDDQEKTLGTVNELLYDTHSNKVRYFVVNLNTNQTDTKKRKVAIPIGLAELHEINDWIILHEKIVQNFSLLPDYHTAAEINPGVENIIRYILTDTTENPGLTGNDSFMHEVDFYTHDHFNEEKLHQRRHTLKTTTGVFDDALEAEHAVLELINAGFNQSAISVSGGKLAETVADIQVTRDDNTPIQGGAVVSVYAETTQQALHASNIMDENGAIEVK